MSNILDIDYLTETECADALGRSTRTLKRWRDRKDGPAYLRLGNQILYRRDAVKSYLLSKEAA